MATKRRLPDPGAVHDEREVEAVIEVLRTSNLNLGPKVAELEQRVAELLAKQQGVMVNSGSSALRLAIDLLELEPGDEIVTPAVTFSTDIAPMVHSRLIPAFVDVEPDTYQIDAERIEEMIGPRTKAILAPNLVGNVPDWDRIREIADRHGLLVVEDSCDVLDSWLGDTRTGTRADISVTSFARGHAITAAGNGGLVGVNDEVQLDRCVALRRWGRRSETYLFGSRKGEKDRFGALADGTPYDLVFLFEDTGYNFEPSEISAAFGNVQLDRLVEFNERRRQNFAHIDDALAPHEDKVTRVRTTPEVETTWMRFPFLLGDGIDRNAMQEFLLERGIPSRMVWTGNILRQPGFATIEHRAPEGGLPQADRVMDRGLTLPSHHGLTSDAVGHIAESLSEYLHSV